MATKKKPVFETTKEELSYLRKQNTGLKGQIGLLNAQKTDLNKCIGSLKDELARCEKVNTGLESQVNELSSSLVDAQRQIQELTDKLAPLKANVDYYNGLPWIVKMFTFWIH